MVTDSTMKICLKPEPTKSAHFLPAIQTSDFSPIVRTLHVLLTDLLPTCFSKLILGKNSFVHRTLRNKVSFTE